MTGPRERRETGATVRSWHDEDAGALFSTRPDASPAEVLDEVRHQLGIGARRVTYSDSTAAIGELRDTIGLDG